MRNLLLFFVVVWIGLLILRILLQPSPSWLSYALIGVIALSAAVAFVGMMRHLLALPEALFNQLEV